MGKLALALAFAGVLLSSAGLAWAEPAPIKTLLERPTIDDVQVSPSGNYLAMVLRRGDTYQLVVRDLNAKTSVEILALKRPQNSISRVTWKSDDRLIAHTVTYPTLSPAAKSSISQDRLDYAEDRPLAFQLIAMDRGGAHRVVLQTGEKQGANSYMTILDRLKGDPDHILTESPYGNHHAPAVFRTDVTTGDSTLVEWGGVLTRGWVINSKGEVVVREEVRGRAIVYEARAPNNDWVEFTRITEKDSGALLDFEFLGPSEDPKKIYVAATPKTAAEGDTRSVHLFDLATHTLGPSVWPATKYDISGILRKPNSFEINGVCYYADVWTCESADPETQKDRAGLIKFFEGGRNIGLHSQSDDGRLWVLNVSGPDEPLSYYMFDRRAKHLDLIGSAFPNLPPNTLGESKTYSYKARDGVTIPAYLTRPPGPVASHLPLIVMPHGGPEARDNLDYDRLVQFLATRGYLVLQPNFRGSGGYGVSFRDAGRRQWGLRMQDDIVDGARALIASGDADPARICIVGASYGGYAALIGGAQSPDLYRCVVSIAGIGDLTAMLNWEREYSDKTVFEYWRTVIGDPEVDHDKIKAASAVDYADKYRPPVLLIHGESDTTVPIAQSDEMNSALAHAGKKVKLVRLRGGHGGWGETDWTNLLTALDGFLADNIGLTGASAVQTSSKGSGK